MGKASKWLRGIFHLNKKPPTTHQPPSLSSSSSCSQSHPNPNPTPTHKPPKKKWSFTKPNKDNNHNYTPNDETSQYGDPTRQAMAVAAATAAAAEVAVAAAQAAAEVVRLTSSGRTTNTTTISSNEMFDWKEDVMSSTWHVNGRFATYSTCHDWAAVKIQSYFRAYLARRALRALKALVKIQALVRGHIVRRRTTDNIRRVQALLRVQARALARRSLNFRSPNIDNKYTHPGPPTPEKSEHVLPAKSMDFDRSMMLKRNGSRSDGNAFNHQGRTNVHEQGHTVKHHPTQDERSDKILQVDPGIYRTPPKHRNLFHSSHLSLCSDQYSQSFTTSKESTAHQTALSPSMYDVQSLYQFKLAQDLEDGNYFTAESSPLFYSATSRDASSRRGPFTPTKSDSSKSCHSGYSDHRSYMSLTESSRAKMRSLSAPRQRPQFERSSSAKRYSTPTHRIDSRLNPQMGSGLHANFNNKVYPGSGYLDRIGMPSM